MDENNAVNPFVMLLQNPLEHGRAIWQYDMAYEVIASVNAALHVALEKSVNVLDLHRG